jgi:hypothetical protein
MRSLWETHSYVTQLLGGWNQGRVSAHVVLPNEAAYCFGIESGSICRGHAEILAGQDTASER